MYIQLLGAGVQHGDIVGNVDTTLIWEAADDMTNLSKSIGVESGNNDFKQLQTLCSSGVVLAESKSASMPSQHPLTLKRFVPSKWGCIGPGQKAPRRTLSRPHLAQQRLRSMWPQGASGRSTSSHNPYLVSVTHWSSPTILHQTQTHFWVYVNSKSNFTPIIYTKLKPKRKFHIHLLLIPFQLHLHTYLNYTLIS